jgi:hypothetical protein
MASIGPSTITGTTPAAPSNLVRAEELGAALVEQGSVGGVEVLRSAAVGVGEIRVSAANKGEDLAVVDDREHDPVAEPVNKTVGAGDGGHPAAVISSAVAPRLLRWLTSPVQPAGAWRDWKRTSSVRSSPNRSVR